jgi:hypothetical protein
VGSLIKMEDEDYKAIEKITQQGLLWLIGTGYAFLSAWRLLQEWFVI